MLVETSDHHFPADRVYRQSVPLGDINLPPRWSETKLQSGILPIHSAFETGGYAGVLPFPLPIRCGR